MKRKIIYFINPISGTSDKGLLRKKISERTEAQHIYFEILESSYEGNYNFLKDKIYDDEITDIVICGGDGTINKIAEMLLDVEVNVGIIPMGSGNGLAFAAKIPKKIDKALDIIFNGKASYIDSFYINDSFCCMLCGFGLDAQVAHDFAKQKSRGLSTYITQAINNYFIAKPYNFIISDRGNTFSTNAYFISVANGNQFGNHFKIAPKASLTDGLLDVVIVKKINKFKLFGSLLSHILIGTFNEYNEKTYSKKDLLYFQTDKLIVRNMNKAPFHIDGDPAIESVYLKFEVVNKAFKLIQPNKA